jgi:histidinol-phosphatase (PHP family)
MRILLDTHTHTTLSDGSNSPAEMIAAAAEKGLSVIALTDHFELHENFPEPQSVFDGAGREESYRHLSDLKDLKDSHSDDSLTYLKGIEIGQMHRFRESALSWLSSHEYDFVLGSVHISRGRGDFYHMNYDDNAPDVVLKQYFEELIELCEWAGESGRLFDSLAHLTYPLRYMRGRGSIDGHLAAIDELFGVMIKYDIALEINTQTYLQSIICPELPQVARFRELGGRLVTIGSDAHSVASLGQGIEAGAEIAKAAGFGECAYFEGREPRFIQL